jgi:hypothetical protein
MPGHETDDDRKARFAAMTEADLKALIIEAIQDQRRTLLADEAIYDEWTAAADDPTTSDSHLRSLQTTYLRREDEAASKQHELAAMISLLGYVPTVCETPGVECARQQDGASS